MPDFTPYLPDCDSTGPSGGSWAGTFARFPACGSRGACHEAARDAGDVLALIPAHLELERCRHAQLAPCAGHAARPVGGAAGDLAHGGEVLEGVRQADNDHAVVQKRVVEGGEGGLLPAVLTRGAAEGAADLANERAAHPLRPRLVEAVAHLCGHVAETGRRTEHDAVVLLELIGDRERCGLLELEPRGARRLRRRLLRVAFCGGVGPGHAGRRHPQARSRARVAARRPRLCVQAPEIWW